MKKILCITFLMLSFSNFAFMQESNSATKETDKTKLFGNFEEVIETKLGKNIMLNNLQKWVISHFEEYQFVIDREKEESGTLVIKWVNHFASETSDNISLNANVTYQISIKDNEYRVKILDGSVKVDPGSNDFSSMSYSEVLLAQEDLEFVVGICEKYFNSKPLWTMDSNFDQIISDYQSKLNAIPQYKNAKKKKINDQWVRMKRNVDILCDIKDGYIFVNNLLYESLKKDIVEDNNL